MTELLAESRRTSARAVNAVMTRTYWLVGRHIVEHEQHGSERAGGEELLARLAADLTKEFGRGFSERNLRQMRVFFLAWPIRQTASAESPSPDLPLPWSHYVRLLAVTNPEARAFYAVEA